MAYRKVEDSRLKAIANAIRTKLGTSGTMTLDEMPVMIAGISSTAPDVVPNYWVSHLAAKTTAINSALNAVSGNRSAFLWYTDAHWATNYGKSPMLIKYLSANTGMEKTFFGGDIATEKSGEISMLTAWKELVKDIPKHYSVIGNHDNQASELTTAEARADFFIRSQCTDGMNSGTDATNGKMYYYVDNSVEKTRYICLSTGRMWVYGDEETWCIDALNSTPSGWHIVILGHLWLNSTYAADGTVTLDTTPPNYVQSLLGMFDAYNGRKSGTTSLHGKAYNFTNASAKIEFLIGGHIHFDYDFRTAGGIPVILTECDGSGERDPGTSATKGTATENCVYGVVADYTAGAVQVINVGRGDTRTISITASDTPEEPDTPVFPEGDYTNQIPISIESDGTLYNGGKGYKENYRINSSGAETADYATGWDITGFIPVRPNDIVRFANCMFYDMDGSHGTQSRASFAMYDESFVLMTKSADYTPTSTPSTAWSPVHDSNGDLIQVTIPTAYGSGVRYMRIAMADINEYSVITVNEEFGSGSGGTEEPVEPDTPDTPDAPEIPEGDYINVLKTAIDTDGSLYNGGKGYKDNYIVDENGVEVQYTGLDTTGYIAAKAGDVIRFKNVTYKVQDNTPLNVTRFRSTFVFHSFTNFYSASTIATWNPVYDADGNIIQITIPSGLSQSCVYFRFNMQDINEYSIITVNEEIG